MRGLRRIGPGTLLELTIRPLHREHIKHHVVARSDCIVHYWVCPHFFYRGKYSSTLDVAWAPTFFFFRRALGTGSFPVVRWLYKMLIRDAWRRYWWVGILRWDGRSRLRGPVVSIILLRDRDPIYGPPPPLVQLGETTCPVDLSIYASTKISSCAVISRTQKFHSSSCGLNPNQIKIVLKKWIQIL